MLVNEVNQMGVLICLDPGHGGTDRGSMGISLFEKNVCLDICYRIEQKLKKYEGMKVTMTRSFDLNMTENERSQWANQQKADLYLSIHTNASVDPSISGFSSYVSVFAGAKTRHIQRWLHNQIVFFLRQVEVMDLGKKNDTESMTGNLDSLRKTRMPAIALGSLFITNSEDHYLLSNNHFLDQYANCIAEGLALIFHCPRKEIKRSKEVVEHSKEVYDLL